MKLLTMEKFASYYLNILLHRQLHRQSEMDTKFTYNIQHYHKKKGHANGLMFFLVYQQCSTEFMQVLGSIIYNIANLKKSENFSTQKKNKMNSLCNNPNKVCTRFLNSSRYVSNTFTYIQFTFYQFNNYY